jgi:hypothetical protein
MRWPSKSANEISALLARFASVRLGAGSKMVLEFAFKSIRRKMQRAQTF